MTLPRLDGPYRLSVEGIDLAVRGGRPGAFALGRVDGKGRFSLSRVGRADDDLQCELRRFIGSEMLFKFAYSPSAAAAFLQECELFHRFRPLGNVMHPSRPSGSTLTCPICERAARHAN